MKTTFLLISGLLCMAGLPQAVASEAIDSNLIRNGGFEEPAGSRGPEGTPDHWERRAGAEGQRIVWARDVAHSGQCSGYVEGGQLETRAGWQQEFSIRPESRYQVTARVKTDPPGSRYLIGLEYLDRRGAWVSRHNLFANTPGAKWHIVRDEFITPIDAVRCRITLRAMPVGQEKAGAWFDDVEVVPLASQAPATRPPRPRPASGPIVIGKTGELRLKGRPFFPIGIYDAPPQAFPQLAEWHFNTVVTGGGDSEETVRLLDEAWKYRLHAIHHPGGTVTTPEGRETIAAAVRRFRNHPSLLAWYPIDEPEINAVPKEPVEAGYAAINQADGGHPVFQTLYYPSSYPIFASSRDVLAIDPYPVPIRPLISIARAMIMAKKEAGSRPVWLIPQAFYALIWTRPPVPEELCCMVYTGLIHGAKGVLYYTYSLSEAGKDEAGKPIPWQLVSTPLWPAIRDLNREIQTLAPVLMMGEDVPVEVQMEGQLTLDWRGEPAIHVLAKRWKGKIYFLAVNLAEEQAGTGFKSAPVSATFHIPGYPKKGNISLPFESRTIPVQEGVFSDRFEPYGVHVYLIEG